MSKPTGNVRVVGYKAKDVPSTTGVSAIIICEDANGVLWKYNAPSFVWDMEPYGENQELNFRQWQHAVLDLLRYTERNQINKNWLEQEYRLGKSVDDTFKTWQEYSSAESEEAMRQWRLEKEKS